MSHGLPPTLFVYGVRSRYAAEIAEILGRLDHDSAAYVDNLGSGPDPPPVDPIIAAHQLPPPSPDHGYVVPLFSPGLRRQVHDELVAAGRTTFPTLIDPTAVVATSATIGEGGVVNAAAVVASNTHIGRFININRSASIGHDNVIDDFVSVAPGCVITGNCRIGRGAFIGAGAVIVPGVSIGDHAVVGAGSVVLRDVPPRTLVVGNPAAVVKPVNGYDGIEA